MYALGIEGFRAIEAVELWQGAKSNIVHNHTGHYLTDWRAAWYAHNWFVLDDLVDRHGFRWVGVSGLHAAI